MMHPVLISFVLLLLLKLGVQYCLDLMNAKSVKAAASSVPEPLQGVMDEQTYARSVEYTLAKNRLGRCEMLYDAIVLLVVLFPWVGGTAPIVFLWNALEAQLGLGVWGQSSILFLIGIALSLPGIPWEWYSQFRLEERFGFNKSTVQLWLTDKIKGLALSMVIGIPIIALVLWLVSLSSLWWLWAFIVLFAFQLVMVVVFPMYIMPLFNKFEELPEGGLRERLVGLGDRTGFLAKTILVMDGSKRSGHSNAFFTGFGRFRRIVLFDTLIEQLSERELEAVLAHEIGHYKKGHIPKTMILAAFSLFVSFAFIGWLAQASWFLVPFGFEALPGQLGPTLLLFALLSGFLTFWMTPLTNRLSRKHEYEADYFAYKALDSDSEPMIGALRALSEKNLSNLTPHPYYSAFYYSHPTLLERESALKSYSQV